MKTNITLRVDKELVENLRKKKVNLSKFFNDAAQVLIFKKVPYLNVEKNDIDFITSSVHKTNKSKTKSKHLNSNYN